MPLTPAKCTQCNAGLRVDPAKDAAICEHCGTPFIVEKAINHYSNTYNITAGVVNVYNTRDFTIRGGVLLNYSGEAAEVVVPDSVVEIGQEVFKNCVGIRSVILPDSVKTIGPNAFNGCTDLAALEIPGSVGKIPDGAFFGCKHLRKVALGQGLKAIGPNAFYGCTDLEELEIPGSVEKIADGAFQGCAHLRKVVLGQGVKSTGAYAFRDCSRLEEITVPDSVSNMLASFKGCTGLRSIMISDECFQRINGELIFRDTPYLRDRKEQAQRLRSEETWRKTGLCRHCGGRLSRKDFTCKSCGKPKDY